jgi:hypothetical protein
MGSWPAFVTGRTILVQIHMLQKIVTEKHIVLHPMTVCFGSDRPASLVFEFLAFASCSGCSAVKMNHHS